MSASPQAVYCRPSLMPWSTIDLTKYGSHVYVLVRRSELRASKIMAKRLTSHPKVTVLWNVRLLQRSPQRFG